MQRTIGFVRALFVRKREEGRTKERKKGITKEGIEEESLNASKECSRVRLGSLLIFFSGHPKGGLIPL